MQLLFPDPRCTHLGVAAWEARVAGIELGTQPPFESKISHGEPGQAPFVDGGNSAVAVLDEAELDTRRGLATVERGLGPKLASVTYTVVEDREAGAAEAK